MLRILTSLFSGIVAYLLLLLMYGPHSQANYQELDQFRQSLETNIAQVREKGEYLEAYYYQLRDQEDALIREAHRIGLLFQNERMMRLRNAPRELPAMSPGQTLVYYKPSHSRRIAVIRAISAAVSVLIFIIMLFIPLYPPEKGQKNSPGTGAPVSQPGTVGSDFDMSHSMRIHLAARE